MLVDTHCHIYKEYYEDINSLIEKINLNKISFIINNACNFNSSLEVLELVKEYENMYCAIGVHPEEQLIDVDKVINLIEQNLDNKKLIAVGEIGLDYFHSKDRKEEQVVMFKKQLDIAQKYNLPIIVHSREATKDTIDILKQYNLRGIIHCFNGSLEVAKEYIKLGYKLGINGIVTFNNCKLIEVLKEISLNDFVLETDSPYLTPVPYRGKLNDPSYINTIIDFLSENLNIEKKVLIDSIYDNVKNIFNII